MLCLSGVEDKIKISDRVSTRWKTFATRASLAVISILYGFLITLCYVCIMGFFVGNKCAFWLINTTTLELNIPGSETFKQAPLSSELWLKASVPMLPKRKGGILPLWIVCLHIRVEWNTPLAQNPRSKLMSFVITAPDSNYHSGQFMD